MDAAHHFRRRAESLRTIAGSVPDKSERQKLFEIAEEYERWARPREGSAPEQVTTRAIRARTPFD